MNDLIFLRDSQWEKAYDLLRKAKVPCDYTKVTLKKKDTCGIYEKTVKWFSYAGPQVHKIQSATFVECMLDLVCPPSRRKVREDGRPQHSDPNFDQACFDLYNRSMEAWVAYNECWDVMNNHDYSPERKADELDVLSMRFLETLLPFGQSTHNYPHLLAAHVSDQLRRFKKYFYFFPLS